MLHGFKPQGEVNLPAWAARLRNYYWYIRVEGRDRAKRRRYYRYVVKEQLRLAEAGIDQELIKAICRYLSSFNKSSAERVLRLLKEPPKQMQLVFAD